MRLLDRYCTVRVVCTVLHVPVGSSVVSRSAKNSYAKIPEVHKLQVPVF